MEALDTKLEKAVPQTQRASSGPEPTASEEASAVEVAFWLLSPAAVERSAATDGRRKRQETMLMTMRLMTSL